MEGSSKDNARAQKEARLHAMADAIREQRGRAARLEEAYMRGDEGEQREKELGAALESYESYVRESPYAEVLNNEAVLAQLPIQPEIIARTIRLMQGEREREEAIQRTLADVREIRETRDEDAHRPTPGREEPRRSDLFLRSPSWDRTQAPETVPTWTTLAQAMDASVGGTPIPPPDPSRATVPGEKTPPWHGEGEAPMRKKVLVLREPPCSSCKGRDREAACARTSTTELTKCAYCQAGKHGCDLVNEAEEMDEDEARARGRWIVEHHPVGKRRFRLLAAPGAAMSTPAQTQQVGAQGTDEHTLPPRLNWKRQRPAAMSPSKRARESGRDEEETARRKRSRAAQAQTDVTSRAREKGKARAVETRDEETRPSSSSRTIPPIRIPRRPQPPTLERRSTSSGPREAQDSAPTPVVDRLNPPPFEVTRKPRRFNFAHSTVVGMSTTYRHVPAYPIDASQMEALPDPAYSDSIRARRERMEQTLEGMVGQQRAQALAREMRVMMDFMFHRQQNAEADLAAAQANLAVARATLYEVRRETQLLDSFMDELIRILGDEDFLTQGGEARGWQRN